MIDHSFSEFALTECEEITRIFLPLLDYPTCGYPVSRSWAGNDSAAESQLYGNTDWIDWQQNALQKESSSVFDGHKWQQADGIASDETIGKVEKLLAQIGSQSALWEFIPFEVFACEFGSRPRTMAASEFCDLWKNRSLPGRLTLQGHAMLDAPVYSDSIIVSGPRGVTKLALALDLEARAVHPAQIMPISMWG